MKFYGKFKTSPVYGALPEVDIDYLVRLLESASWQVGDETREIMIAAINKHRRKRPQDGRISFCDTPVFGNHYVYLWFDSEGKLFYIGKGTGNRAESLQGRNAEFKEKAEGGCYKILAGDMDEGYALDLEKILLLECASQRKPLVNKMNGDAVDALEYCSGDREVLLWYWDHLGVISRFSELTGIDVFYDVKRNTDALEERTAWWGHSDMHPKTNDPKRLAEIRAAEEKKQRQKARRREYVRRRNEKLTSSGAV